MSLKNKTVNGLLWSFIDNLSKQGLTFLIGIILARLLSPREFGLIGMITIFLAISHVFLSGGFGEALIRKKNCTQEDYSTVFFYNLSVSLLFFLILFSFSGSISRFYNEPQLKIILRVLSFSLVINAFIIIQQTLLVKRIDFKLQTKISLVSGVLTGIISIFMAFTGYGVWSLVIKIMFGSLMTAVLFWIFNSWRPSLVFSKSSFRELFIFGNRILFSNLIETIYRNIYLLIIGKYFSASELGYYTRADHFKNLPSSHLTIMIQRVSYPVLSEIREDRAKLKLAYSRLIKSAMLISFVMMFGLFAIAEPLVVTLVGEKWLPSVEYLQLLCFVGALYPVNALNLNMLNVQGRSDLYLRLEIIKKTLTIPVIIIGINLGIKMMLLGMIMISIFGYYINSYWSGRLVDYSLKEQIRDILPSFIIAVITGLSVILTGVVFNGLSSFVLLGLQLLTGIVIFFGICEITNFKDYIYLKGIALEKLKFKENEI